MTLRKGLSITALLKRRQKTTEAQGRLRERQPVAIIDIGSNSVRLVTYEGLTRSPAVLFNEKVLCGLGEGVAKTGRLDDAAVERALIAIKRFYQLATQSNVSDLHVLATAAAREAENGASFIDEVEKICGITVQLLSGKNEAYYAGLGASSGFYQPDGIVGDLGGGSMELIPTNSDMDKGHTTPLGGLRLQESCDGDLSSARKIARKELADVKIKWPGNNKRFYAIGGTWRSLARLHILDSGYPLDVVHNYTVKAKDYIEFCKRVIKEDLETFNGIDEISKNRQNLLPFGAAALIETLEHLGAKQVSMSATGLREGYLYSLLDEQTKSSDALLEATGELAILRSRSPQHSIELAEWTQQALKAIGIEESENERRWRIAACNLADISWRAASDFRAEQTLGIINNAGFNSISHEGRAYLAIVNFHRYQGLGSKKVPPEISNLATEDTAKKARLQAALFRVLYLFSASVEDVLPELKLVRTGYGNLVLQIPKQLEVLVGERPMNRIEQLGRELDEDVSIEIS